MANHRAAAVAAFLLIASLVLVVTLSGADARSTVLLDEKPAALTGANNTQGQDAAAGAVVDPECDDDGKPNHKKHPKHHKHGSPPHPAPEDKQKPEPAYPNLPAESPHPEPDSVDQELCSECEKPKTPEPPCNSCEEPKEPEMTCNKVHSVRDGETCYSMGQCAGLGQDDFLRFNPNICCDHLFVGQWVCLDATCAD